MSIYKPNTCPLPNTKVGPKDVQFRQVSQYLFQLAHQRVKADTQLSLMFGSYGYIYNISIQLYVR